MKQFKIKIIPFLLLFTTITGLLVFTGCLTSPPKKYFQIHITGEPAGVNTPSQANRISNDTAIEKPHIIMIEPVEVEDIYNDYRLVYRTSPYELNYYSYCFWVKRPDKMIRDAIFDTVSGTGLFARVIYRCAEGEPGYKLRAKVNVLEEYDLNNDWYAHLKMELEILAADSGKTIAFHRFDNRQRLSKRKVEEVPGAISQILKKEVNELLKKFQEEK